MERGSMGHPYVSVSILFLWHQIPHIPPSLLNTDGYMGECELMAEFIELKMLMYVMCWFVSLRQRCQQELWTRGLELSTKLKLSFPVDAFLCWLTRWRYNLKNKHSHSGAHISTLHFVFFSSPIFHFQCFFFSCFQCLFFWEILSHQLDFNWGKTELELRKRSKFHYYYIAYLLSIVHLCLACVYKYVYLEFFSSFKIREVSLVSEK